MIIIAEKMVAGGTCLGRIDGKAVFISGALPGETIDVRLTRQRSDYAFAEIIKVIEPSKHRITPVCPLFGTCGGCSLQMADNEYQKELRMAILQDVMRRTKVEVPGTIELLSDDSFEYRSRFQFHRLSNDSIGLKEESGHTIIPLLDCPIAVPVIRQELQNGKFVDRSNTPRAENRFHVFGWHDMLWYGNDNSVCTVPLIDKSIRFNVKGFFQSNIPMMNRVLTTLKKELGTGKRFLDMYAGVGTFSHCIGDSFKQLVLVEHNAAALEMAATNLKGRTPSPVYCAVSDEHWPDNPEAKKEFDLIVVDPPRQGISKKTLEWILSSQNSVLVYLSCDPVTFARDAHLLITGGFSLSKTMLCDFYPQTHHIETLGFFHR